MAVQEQQIPKLDKNVAEFCRAACYAVAWKLLQWKLCPVPQAAAEVPVRGTCGTFLITE